MLLMEYSYLRHQELPNPEEEEDKMDKRLGFLNVGQRQHQQERFDAYAYFGDFFLSVASSVSWSQSNQHENNASDIIASFRNSPIHE